MERDYRPSYNNQKNDREQRPPYRDDRNGRPNNNYRSNDRPMNTRPVFWTPEIVAKFQELVPQHTKDGIIDFNTIAQLIGSNAHACLNKFTSLNEPTWTELEVLQLTNKWTESNGCVTFEELAVLLAPHSLQGIKMKLENTIRERKLVPTYRMVSNTPISIVYEIKELAENSIFSKNYNIPKKLNELTELLKTLLSQ
ncbi:hypothetical protein SS50377_24040 [Spironucleus salmonicida]|uniref:Myb-like DNA-binding domain-containing protein n=1 Tax=Spironucleus salmonicida TaxID=348837 RepID=V6LTP4_9EUKA|nr:hypothetical protein SS50377_24040 [Spironucleus salmonicida]|eukprot:EST47071.1 Hypothetical protein SS50377_12882 [Spironucleus salmonicida]